jgi:pimeloyl-ACP methyl ester carboxylesterase
MECKQLVVGGIAVTIFSKGQNYECGIFMLHGRQSSVEDFIRRDSDLIESLVTEKHCVLLFDQRNHGPRLVNEVHNQGKKTNPHHPLDMYAIQYGTAKDVQFLIDTIPLFLPIKRWGVFGFSLGGHATFLSLAHEARLVCGVSVVGCGDYCSLMKSRGIELSSEMLHLLKATDPIHRMEEMAQKHTSAIYGGKDTLVPYTANTAFEQQLGAKVSTTSGSFTSFVDPEAGHEFTPLMKKKLADFLHSKL